MKTDIIEDVIIGMIIIVVVELMAIIAIGVYATAIIFKG